MMQPPKVGDVWRPDRLHTYVWTGRMWRRLSAGENGKQDRQRVVASRAADIARAKAFPRQPW